MFLLAEHCLYSQRLLSFLHCSASEKLGVLQNLGKQEEHLTQTGILLNNKSQGK